ncbi:MAG: hypothetical protein V3V81_07510 [Candidatus Bathyarchaeia archaeon]
MDESDHYDNYVERICIRMAEGHQGERWARNEAAKETKDILRNAGYKAHEACKIMTQFRHRALADGVTSEF